MRAGRLVRVTVALASAVWFGACASSDDGGGGSGGGADATTDAGGGDGGIQGGYTLEPFTPPEKNAIIGQVVSTDGAPVEGVSVTAGGQSTTTNYDGLYALEVTPGERIVVRFLAAGYAELSRPGALLQDGQVTVNAVLPRRSASVEVTAGVAMAVPGGAVTVPEGAVVDKDGNAATGVRVRVTPIDVTGPEIAAAPGDFSATTTGGDTAQLETFGMAEYQVTDATGAALEIKAGETVGIEILLPADTDLKDGDVVPAWHFDQATGRWIEEGTGTVKVSSQDATRLAFVADVGHFSWWNCDKTMETTCVRGVVKNCDGTPAAGADIQMEGVDYDGTSTAWAGTDGTFCGPARRNSSVRLYAASGWGANRLVAAADVTTPDVASTCGEGTCAEVTITLPCTPAESDLDCDDTWFAGCKGCVQGKVLAEDGSPISSAKVEVTTGKTSFTRLTDAAGVYCSPAALGSVATVVASAGGGATGGTTFTPVAAGACPDCGEAPTITLAPPATGSGSDLDFGPCLEKIGGVTLEPPVIDGADPNIALLNDGWATLTRTVTSDDPVQQLVQLDIALVPAGTTSDTFGAPVSTIILRLPSAPTAGTTYSIVAGEAYSDTEPYIRSQLWSRTGVNKGQGNETFEAMTAPEPVGSGWVRFDTAPSNHGDPAAGAFEIHFAPDCAARASTVALKGAFAVTYYDWDVSFIPTGVGPDSDELQAWICGLYGSVLLGYTYDTWWNGVISADLDGAPVPTDPESLSGTATYSWKDDQLLANIYSEVFNGGFTIDHPVSGENVITGGYATTGDDCYYTLVDGTALITGFTGPDTDTWLTATWSFGIKPAEGIAQPGCVAHTVSGQLGAPVCSQ